MRMQWQKKNENLTDNKKKKGKDFDERNTESDKEWSSGKAANQIKKKHGQNGNKSFIDIGWIRINWPREHYVACTD